MKRSAFVTALAWIFIVLTSFSTLIAILQNIMAWLLFPALDLSAAADQAQAKGQMPEVVAFMFRNFKYFFAVTLVASAMTLAASIGLLLRRNWARIAFIAMMVLGIAWNVAGMVFMVVFFSAMSGAAKGAPPDFASQFGLMSNLIMGFNILLTVGFMVLLGWIIKRPMSAWIREEFQ